MNILKTALIAAALAGAAFASTAARAAPAFDSGVAAPALTQDVRVVCDEWGRCWRTRPRYYAPPTVYGPPRFYYGRPGYAPGWRHRHHHHNPRPPRDWHWR